MGKKKGKKLSEEKALSDLLFGSSEVSGATEAAKQGKSNSTIKKGNHTSTTPKETGDEEDSVEESNGDDESVEISFEVDRGKSNKESASGTRKRKDSVWDDEDDEDLEVDLTSKNKFKKLQKPDENGRLRKQDRKVSGKELSTALKERFSSRQLDWASISANDGKEDEASKLLKRTGAMVVGGKGKKSGKLPQGRIDVSRLVDANAADASKSAISSIEFHHEGSTLMVASQDRTVKFFRIDGDTNEKVSSLRLADMNISCAAFQGKSSDVIIGGRKPYFYHYEGVTGKVSKIPGLMGKGLKSHETFTVSPQGSRVAFLGAGGYTHIVDGQNKTWQMDVKCNTAVRAATFSDETTLFTSGLDADVYQWDLRMAARCLSRFKHEDGTCTSALAMSPNSSYLAVGAESGVMSLFDANSLPRGAIEQPSPVKSALNLTTRIGTMCFHPSSQVVAYASQEINDQLRMMHLPSYSVFTNWPTERTPLRKVSCMAFSPHGAYLAAGNDRGRVLLYRLNHFQTS